MEKIFEDFLDRVQATDIEEPDNLDDELNDGTFEPTDYIDIDHCIFYTTMG